jgi:hypothetical protein
MPHLDLPWWPPSSYDALCEHQVRELFASLRAVTPPVMAEGERRMRAVIGPDAPIRIHHVTVKGLTGSRLGQGEVLKLIALSAGSPREDHDVRFVIELHRDGTLMVTPSLNPATHLEWERWTMRGNPPARSAMARRLPDRDGLWRDTQHALPL